MSLNDPETVYDPTPDLANPATLFSGIWHDLWAGRELAWRLFVRNMKGVYRQTVLGMFWIFLPPLANTAIWIFLRNRNVFDFEALSGGAGQLTIDPTVYILTGMILWQSFVDGLQMPLAAINSNRAMISRLNFPREALIVEGLYDLFVNMTIRLLLLIPAFLIYQVPIQGSIVLAIPLILLMVLNAVGWGLILVPFGSLYHDVLRFITIAIPFWMIMTPIIYVLPNKMPGALLNWLNPASPLLVASRDMLLLGGTEHVGATLLFAALALPIFILGLVVYRVAIPALIERMAAS